MNTKGKLSDKGICPPDPTDKNLKSRTFVKIFS